MKECRKSEFVYFVDVCESVKRTGRSLSISVFRQILQVAPSFYTHSWVNSKLVVDCSDELRLNNVTQTRKATFKSKLLQLCTEAFFEFCKDHSIENPEHYIDSQVWHHDFDPHTMAPNIEMKELLPMPALKQTESVQDFVRKSAIEVNKTPIETEKIPFNSRLQELSQKTGISMQTLLQVKTVEHKVKE